MDYSLLSYRPPYSCSDGSGLSNNSVTTKYWDTNDSEVQAASLTSAVFTLCFIIVGLPSNIFIIVSILRQRLYKQSTHILLLNLTIADLLVCLLVLPFTVISGFAGGFIFGDNDRTRCQVCQLGITLTIFTIFSLHILALLSVDRFIFIKYPMKYHKFVSIKRVTITVTCLWIFCIILSLFPLFGFGDITFSYTISTCTLRFDGQTRVTKNIHYALFLAIESVLPLGVLVFTNIWIICIIQKQIRKIYNIKNGSVCGQEEFVKNIRSKLNKTKYSKQLHLIKVFGAMLFANVVTWLPLMGHIISTAIIGNNFHPASVHVFVYITFICYPVLHPIIQASLIPEVRNLVIKVLCCHGKCKEVGSIRGVRDTTVELSYCECFVNRRCTCLDFLSVTVLPIRDELDGM